MAVFNEEIKSMPNYSILNRSHAFAGALAAIADVTEVKYTSIVHSLIATARASRPEESEFSWTWLLDDLHARCDLRPSTKETYRAALLWETHMRLVGARDSAEEKMYVEAYERLKRWRFATSRMRPARKSIPEADLSLLLECLVGRGNGGSEVSADAAAWLKATVITGLRPCEWIGANWRTPSDLTVINAKVKRCAPAYRRALLDPVECDVSTAEKSTREIHIEDPDEVDAVRDHIGRYWRRVRPGLCLDSPEPDLLKAHLAHYHAVRAAIRRACKHLWKKAKHSLYSARHQFSANSRAEVGPEETEKAMGHKRRSSSGSWYAGPSFAHTKSRVKRAHRISQGINYYRWKDGPGSAPEDDTTDRPKC